MRGGEFHIAMDGGRRRGGGRGRVGIDVEGIIKQYFYTRGLSE